MAPNTTWFVNLVVVQDACLPSRAGAIEYTDCFSAEGVRPPNECPRYDTKQSDGDVPVMLDLWEMWSIPSLPSLPGSFWPRVVAPDRVLSIGQMELNCVLMLN